MSQHARANAGEPAMRVAKRCGVGAVRERNEDSCLVFTSETGGHFPLLPFGLYVVADGMGGHKNGHIASKIAFSAAAKHVIERIYLPLLQMDGLPGATPIQEVLEDAVQLAHRALFDPTDGDGQRYDADNCSCFGGLLMRPMSAIRGFIYSTGDRSETVTIDHSLVQRLQDVGQLTAEERQSSMSTGTFCCARLAREKSWLLIRTRACCRKRAGCCCAPMGYMGCCLIMR